jgi:hypothetical protein
MGKFPDRVQTERELPDEDQHNGVCIAFTDLGTHSVTYEGKTKEQRQCQLTFQLVDLATSEGKAMNVWRTFNFTDSEKGNFAKTLKAWLGIPFEKTADFDPVNCLGKPALINIVHNNGYANIDTIGMVPKGFKVKKPTEKLRSLFLYPDQFDVEVYNALPDYLKNKIATTAEYAECQAPRTKKVAKPVAKPIAAPTKKIKK